MWSGAYRIPPPMLTSSPQHELVLIDKVIGFGEIAISDHRSSAPTWEELSRLVGDVRVAGMLSGKVGKVHFHVGRGSSKLEPLWKIIENTQIPIDQMYPTHIASRGPELIEEGKRWIKAGGTLDFTAGEQSCISALQEYLNEGINLAHVTISSDAYGSNPVFDEYGRLVSYDYQRPYVLLETIKELVVKHGWSLAAALPLCTKNPAIFLGLDKGTITVGSDADVVILSQNFSVNYVLAKGITLKTPTWIKRPMFASKL